MSLINIFTQYKPLEMETVALKASLEKIEGEVKENLDDKELFLIYQGLKADILSRITRIMQLKKTWRR